MTSGVSAEREPAQSRRWAQPDRAVPPLPAPGSDGLPTERAALTAGLRGLPLPLQRAALSRIGAGAGNRAVQGLVSGLSSLKGPGAPEAGTPVVQRALDADLKAMTDVYGPVHYEGMLAAIRAAPVDERRAALANDALRAQITARLGRFATQIMAALLEGSQQWRNPPSNDFFDYFVTRGGRGTLPATATMNCWEAILYAAYLAGQISAAWIRNFYTNALSAADPNAMLWTLLGASSSLPTYPAHTPREGQLLFYYRSGGTVPVHVALSMGGDEAISLWNQPNNNRAVQHIRVTDLSGTVHVGDAPW